MRCVKSVMFAVLLNAWIPALAVGGTVVGPTTQPSQFPFVVDFDKGASRIKGSDQLTITHIWGTAKDFSVGNTYAVQGTYTLNCRNRAWVAIFTTTHYHGPQMVNVSFDNFDGEESVTSSPGKAQASNAPTPAGALPSSSQGAKNNGGVTVTMAPTAVPGQVITKTFDNAIAQRTWSDDKYSGVPSDWSDPVTLQPQPKPYLVTRGSGTFFLSFELKESGWPHVSFYPEEGGTSLDKVYFGKDEFLLPETEMEKLNHMIDHFYPQGR